MDFRLISCMNNAREKHAREIIRGQNLSTTPRKYLMSNQETCRSSLRYKIIGFLPGEYFMIIARIFLPIPSDGRQKRTPGFDIMTLNSLEDG